MFVTWPYMTFVTWPFLTFVTWPFLMFINWPFLCWLLPLIILVVIFLFRHLLLSNSKDMLKAFAYLNS